MKIVRQVTILIGIACLNAVCGAPDSGTRTFVDSLPLINPDYAGVTIPPNIAPMNFTVQEEGSFFRIRVTSSAGESLSLTSRDGKVRFPEREWKRFIDNNKGDSIKIEISVT